MWLSVWIKKKSNKDSEAKNIQINFHCKVKELLQWRITGLNVNIMTKYECVSCLVIAIIVAFFVVIHVQCLVSAYLSLVKIKYSVCVWKKKKKRKLQANIRNEYTCKNSQWNTSKPNSAAHWKIHSPWSSGVYTWDARMVQHMQINKCDTSH